MGSLTTKFKLDNSDITHHSSDREIIPVRVKDIILDESHSEYVKFGEEQSIGLIKFTTLNTKQDDSDTKLLPYAFPLNTFNLTYPLINEVVLLVKGPREERNLEKVDYYLTIVGLYNDINYIPSIDSNETVEEPGYSFKTSSKIKPLHPFHGDTLIQGRNGQSIRLTGAISPKNTFADSSNANKPLLIISNGHNSSGSNTYVEDINRDDTSIYLCSDHTIPLNQSRTKYASAKQRPVLANSFKGSQAIINSGRLFFNSTKDDIQFSSQTNFGVTSKILTLDSVDYIGLDAKKIYLGENARRFEFQPAILGTQLETFFDTLLSELERTGQAMKKAKTIDGKIIPELNIAGVGLEETIKILKKWINPGGESLLKSKKVYVE